MQVSESDWATYYRWRPSFIEILDQRFYPIEWLDERVWSGDATLIACEDAAAIVELRHYPTGATEGHGLLCAGDLDAIKNCLIPRWLEQLRSIGAISAVVESREGWAKALKSLGFDPYQVSVRKMI